MDANELHDSSPAPRPGRAASDRQHWQELSAVAARDLPAGRVGGVIAQLRQRGRVASRRASVFLGFLLTTVLLGLAYYIGLPLLRAYAEGTTRTWRDQVQAAEADNVALDQRRTAALAELTAALAQAPEVIHTATDSFATPLVLGDGTLIAIGESGTILRSIDHGAIWTEMRAPLETSTPLPSGAVPRRAVATLSTLTDGTLIATVAGGTILRSSDRGATWQEVRTGSEEGETFSTPLALADGTLIAMGEAGTILRSGDHGATWSEVWARSEMGTLSTPLALTDGTLISAGYGGTILRSSDRGATWLKVRNFSHLDEYFFPPLSLADGTLIAAGGYGTILRSSDRGATWLEVWARGSGMRSEYFSVPFALADGTLIATGFWGTILHSSDHAATWRQVRPRSESGEGFSDPLTLAGGTLITMGDSGTILRSSDHGATWSEVRTPTHETFTTPLELADGTLITTGYDGTILRSSDHGATWSEVRTTPSDERLRTPLELADGTLITTGYDGTFLRSSDRGATWPEVRAPSGDYFDNPLELADGTLITIGRRGTVLRSSDHGATWSEVRTPTGTDGQFSVTPVTMDDGTVIAIGVSGDILRLSGDTAARLRELTAALPPGGAGDAPLPEFVSRLDSGVRVTKPVAASISALEHVATERVPVEAGLVRARANLAKWSSGAAAEEVRRAGFAAFMADCRKGAAEPEDAALTTACLDAYTAGQAGTERQWWESLADKVPPGILLLFLLATLSGLYRYNVRLAGFHDGRADALELMVAEVNKDLLTAVSDALAADKVEFGAAKTPIDNAVDMATALLNRAKP